MSSWKRRSAVLAHDHIVLVLAAHFRDQFGKLGQLCIVDARLRPARGFASIARRASSISNGPSPSHPRGQSAVSVL